MPDNTFRLLSARIASFFDEVDKADSPNPPGLIKSRLMEMKLDAQALENGQSLAEAYREISALQTLKESLEAQNKVLDTKAKDYESLSDKATEAARLLQNKQKAQEDQTASQQKEIERLVAENDGLRQGIARRDGQMHAAQSIAAQQGVQIEELSKELKDAVAKAESFEAENKRLANEVESLTLDIALMQETEAMRDQEKAAQRDRVQVRQIRGPIIYGNSSISEGAQTVLLGLAHDQTLFSTHLNNFAKQCSMAEAAVEHHFEMLIGAGLVREIYDEWERPIGWGLTPGGRAFLVKKLL